MEDLAAASSLKLVNANKQASRYTGSDLSQSVGKYLLEAFPALAQTDMPELYAEIVRTKQPHTIGAFEYSDFNIAKAYYAVKAFPMPNACVGILFENITLRKQLEEMVKHRAKQVHPPQPLKTT